jgi:hypothetical protein
MPVVYLSELKRPAMRQIILLCALAIAANASAQNTRKLTLYFDTDKHDLTEVHQRQLTNFLSLLPKADDVRFTVYGHTDDVASNDYNEALSLRRGNSVRTFLVTRSVTQESIEVSAFGETKLVADANEDLSRSKSRRVEVIATWEIPVKPEGIEVLYEQLKNKPQEFCIKRDRDTILRSASGTIFRYTAGSMAIPKGQLLCDCVTLKLLEVNDKASMITQNTPTVSGGRMLITGGMFRVEAEMCGVATSMRPGYDLGVLLPATERSEDMMVFYANEDESGNLDWGLGSNPQSTTYFEADTIIDWIGGWEYRRGTYRTCPLFWCRLNRLFGFNDLGKVNFYRQRVRWDDSLYSSLTVSFGDYNGEMLQGALQAGFAYQAFSIPRLGWINCDRISATPQTRLMSFQVTTPGDAYHDVRIVFKDINSIMMGYRNEDHFSFERIPKNEEIVIVALRFVDDKPALAMISANTSDGKVEVVDYELIPSLTVLRQKLAVLNQDA